MINKPFTKSVILLTMRGESTEEFYNWFKAQLKSRNLGIRSGARFIGISHPTVSDIINFHEKPSCESCLKIADAFRVNREFVLRLAGWLDPIPDQDEIMQQTFQEFGLLNKDAQRIVSRVIHTIREESETYRTH